MKRGFNINKSFYDKIDKIEEIVEQEAKEEARAIANYAIDISPVDTGAYVTSFSLKDSYSSGRGRTSKNKPKFQNPEHMKEQAKSQIWVDLQKIDWKSTTKIVLSNGSPHAREVEDGGPTWNKTEGYGVFRRTKARFR